MASIENTHFKYPFLSDHSDFAPNLFEVTSINEYSDKSLIHTDLAARLRISSINVPGVGLTFERDKTIKKFVPTNFDDNGEVTITWLEDTNLIIRKFHAEWFSNFYVKQKNGIYDYWVEGLKGKKKNFTIKYYKKYSANKDSLIFSDYSNGNSFDFITIKLIGMMPKGLSELNFNWNDNSSNTATFQYSYSVDNIEIDDGLAPGGY